jgi:hypothetical protein
MNSRLSFRKESIQRSSNASETLSHALEAQGQRAAHDQPRISITVISTLTIG